MHYLVIQSGPKVNREHSFGLKNGVFWDVAPCGFCVNRRFGGSYSLHFQGRRTCERSLWYMNESWLLDSEYLHEVHNPSYGLWNEVSSTVYLWSHTPFVWESELLISSSVMGCYVMSSILTGLFFFFFWCIRQVITSDVCNFWCRICDVWVFKCFVL
jgi:hypothetical protein